MSSVANRLAGLCNIEGKKKQSPTIPAEYGQSGNFGGLSATDAVKASGLSEEEIASPICGVSYGSTKEASVIKRII